MDDDKGAKSGGQEPQEPQESDFKEIAFLSPPVSPVSILDQVEHLVMLSPNCLTPIVKLQIGNSHGVVKLCSP